MLFRASILHTLRYRFHQDCIYTSIGPILVAINPFKWITSGGVNLLCVHSLYRYILSSRS